MYNADKIYIGFTECKHWKNVNVREQTCCGGRTRKVAFVKCDLNGEIPAWNQCASGCPQAKKDGKEFLEGRFEIVFPNAHGVQTDK